jgi:hypothetical protein
MTAALTLRRTDIYTDRPMKPTASLVLPLISLVLMGLPGASAV